GDLRRRARLAEEAVLRVLVVRDLRMHDLDDARRAEILVRGLEDLAHAPRAEALDDLVLPVEQIPRVLAGELRDHFPAMRAGPERGIDLSFATEAAERGHKFG